MAAPINLQANVQIQNLSQMQREIQQATQNLKINMGGGNAARSLSALSQPLGRLTGQADEFSKSLDAANARVLAFGASVGIVNTLSNAFKSLVNSTIEVEKAITAISVVGEQFAGKSKQLSQGLFSIAKATGQSFEEVSKAALEFSRQGLQLEDTLQRTQDALILTRLTGLDASKSVDGLTASVNAFAKAGLSTTQILNKLAAVDQAFAVSSADLIEGFNRSAAVAQNAGVTFDELAGIITTLQQETSRGGAVIGNALKTIFTRLQDTSTLNQLQKLGVAVQDLEGNLLPARQILQNLATDVEGLGQITRAGIFKDVAGTFQINQLISLVGDLGKANSVTAKATQVSAGATNEAFTANQKLNQSLDAIINKVSLTGKQLGALLGEIGLGDNLKGILDGINSFLEGASNLLQGDDLGSRFAKGIVKGIGSVLSGPGIGLFLAIIAKLSFDLAKFGVQSLKTFFNIGQSAKEQQQVQESIVQTLIRNKTVLSQILNTQGGQNAQASAFLNILKQEEQVLQNIRTLAGGIAAPVIAQGYRSGSQGLTRLSAGGYLPAQEASDVRRGVGGASPSSKVVSIPNFAFGGGKRGTMIANTSEYIVPNYAGGGSAIFNQDMVKTMGLPAGAKKITASGGFIPNFSGGTKDNPLDVHQKYALLVNDLNSPRLNQLVSYKPRNEDKVYYKANVYGIGETENLQGIGQIDRFKSQFSTKFLEEKYKNLALEDIEKYANAVIGQPISPVAQVKLANKGSVPSLIGSIFESAIISALKDPDLIEAQLNRDDNAPFDFKGVAKSQFNKFFGIDENINFVEAKYADNDATRQSFASKIYRLESGKYIDKPKTEISTDLKGRWLSYNNLSSKKSIEAKEMYKSIAQDLGLDPIRDRTQINALMNKATGRSSSGYIPNFASDALQAAISRERSAGISASQIYVDQSPALKSAANPMGLMVANRRDEPAGGFQGVSRARREGVNPKTYGAANGFVPNFAPVVSDTDQVKASKGFGDLAGKFFVLQGALSFFEGGFIQAGSAAQKVNDALQTLTTALFAFQAVQQLSAKTETKNITIATNNISKFSQVIKDAKDKVQKWQKEFVAGGGSRASIVSRGGRLPSNTSFATRLSSSLGTSKLAGSLRNFVGNPLETISSTFKSFTGVALAATVALKGFNDIAALFYTRGDKLDSSLELLSSSASKASSSLSDIDKAVLKSINTSLGDIGIGGTITKLFSSLSPMNLGRETVAYNSGGQTQITNLKGGQTDQDFAKVQQELSSLIFSSLRASLPKAPEVAIANDTKAKISELLQASTENGILDLQKVINSDYVESLRKVSNETAKKIEIITANAEFNKPVEQFKKIIEKIISDGALVVENSSKTLERESQLISSITSSKAFASLSDSSKIIFEINSSSTQLKKDIENRISKFASDAQSSLLEFIPELGLNPETAQNLKDSIGGLGKSTTEEEFVKNLQSFNEALEKSGQIADQSKLQALDKKISETTNSFKNLQKQVENEQAILAFNNSEKLLEARAYDTYKNKLASFVNSMVEGEKKLIQLRGEIERIDIQKQGNIDILSAQAKTSRDAISIRREEELKAFNAKNPKEKDAALTEKTLAIKREFFTKENIAGLNRNTDALNALTKLLAADFIAKIDSAISALQNGSNELDNTLMSNVDKIQLPEEMKRQDALKYLTDLRGVYSPSATLPMKSGGNLKTAEGFIDQITGFIQSGQGFADIQSNIEQFQAPQDMRDRLIEVSKDLYESYQKEGAVSSQTLETLKKRFDIELETYDAVNSYSSKLEAQTRALRDSLSDPQTVGEFVFKQREIARNEREQAKGSPDEQRAYRSSFGYGLSQGFDEVEKRTFDFKNELGKEIPQLFSSNLTQGLNDAISGAKSLKDALRDAATSFFQAITQKNIENIANLVTGGVGNVAQSFFASGGQVNGGSGVKDDVPAMLMGGEYVIKKSSVQKYGSKFLDSLNRGSIKGFASGGGVQSGSGGFYAPGEYGTGGIRGKRELLSFATQSFSSGQYDTMGGFGMSGASVSLEAESGRLSQFGRQNNPMFERVQESKQQAFDVYLQQLKQEEQYQEQLKEMEAREKERQKQLVTSIVSAVVSSVVSVAGARAKIGAENQSALNQLSGQPSGLLSSLKGAGKGLFTSFGNSLSGEALTLRAITNPALQNASIIGSGRGVSQAGSALLMSGSNTYSKGIIQTGGNSLIDSDSNVDLSKLNLQDYGSDGSYNPYNPLLPPPNGWTKRASGGLISGGSGMRDDVPAMLSGGEFVLNNRATRKLGVQNLNRLNAGETNTGEGDSSAVTESLISKLDELIQATRESAGDNVVVNVSSNEAQAKTENTNGNEKELQRKIKQAVLDVIAQEKRLGGSLTKGK